MTKTKSAAQRLKEQAAAREAIRAASPVRRHEARPDRIEKEGVEHHSYKIDALFAPITPYRVGRRFSPANTQLDLEATFRAQNDRAAFSVGRVPPSWPVTARDEECPLGGIEQPDAGIDFCPDDDGAPANVGFRWFTHRDAQRQRRPLHNARKDRDARSDVRVGVHNSGASEFRVPDDVLKRVCIDDREKWALELLDAVVDEPPVYRMDWLRDEAIDHLAAPRRTHRKPIVGRVKPKDHLAGLNWTIPPAQPAAALCQVAAAAAFSLTRNPLMNYVDYLTTTPPSLRWPRPVSDDHG